MQNARMDVELYQQPPNSPDMNVLDLCFFRSIQSLKVKTAPRNMSELDCCDGRGILHCCRRRSLNNGWLTLQSCLDCILRCKGGNNYQLAAYG